MKAIIVGGGIIGLSVAGRLAEEGWEAVVVDHGQRLPATEVATGILLPDSSNPCKGIAGQWSSEALRAWDGWYKTSETRSAFLFYQEKSESSSVYRDWLLDQGIGVKRVASEDLRLPISREVIQEMPFALHIPHARTVVTENITQRLRGKLQIVRERATDILLLEGQARGIRTKHSLHSGDIVIGACGWSDWDWSPLRPPLIPWQGERVLFGGFPHRLPLLQTGEGALVGRGGGRLWAGVSFREDSSGLPRALDSAEIINRALRWLPDLRHAHIISIDAGIRPGTADGLPIIGKTKIPGLYMATGHGRGGILGAPLTANILVEIISGHSSTWSEALSPDRVEGWS